MTADFDYFVVFGEMRTGSNFLEENINLFPGLHSYGEAFNPHFIGGLNKSELFEMTMTARDADPLRLIDRMVKDTDGLPGFRFFHDHDARVADACLPNPRCAKVVLTRNPVESYVSWKIASQTGQWRLKDAKHQKVARIRFDEADFTGFLERIQAFQLKVQHALQVTGQTAFYIGYEDINDLDVLNGMAQFLGQSDRLETLSTKLVRQNPSPLSEKVVNYEEMERVLASFDRFDLSRTPNFEPRRGPGVPTYLAAAKSPLLYLPVKCGPVDQVTAWLAALDNQGTDALQSGFSQKSLRQWKKATRGGRSFTVVSHPVTRAYRAFSKHILPVEGEQVYSEIRNTLRRSYKVPLPKEGQSFGKMETRDAFLAYLKVIKGNLAGQTSFRIDPAWASQTMLLQSISDVQLPDHILRESDLAEGLARLCLEIGAETCPEPQPEPRTQEVPLAEIYDADIESAAQSTYGKDYMSFGFGAWAP